MLRADIERDIDLERDGTGGRDDNRVSEECCGPVQPRSATTTAAASESLAREHSAAPIHSDTELAPWWRDRALGVPAVSGALLASSLIAMGWGATGWPVTVLQSLSVLAGAMTFVPGAMMRLMRGSLGVGLLMTIAAIGAVLLGHIGEAAALAFLFSIAEALEDRAMDRARHGLRALLSLIPETALIERGPSVMQVAASEVGVDDVLVVRAGERIATDGVVLSGRSSVDTSAVTGESIPVTIESGDTVLAGSINGSGAVRMRATANGTDNSLTTIVRLVEEATARKGNRARLADRIARPLVPIVLAVAAAIVGFGFLAVSYTHLTLPTNREV